MHWVKAIGVMIVVLAGCCLLLVGLLAAMSVSTWLPMVLFLAAVLIISTWFIAMDIKKRGGKL